jgi:ribose transport system substrate-binding protein
MRIIKLLPLLAILFALSSCKQDKKRVVAVIPKGSAHLFWQSVHAGALKAAGETGVDIAWNGPAIESDSNAELQIMDSMINRHVDAIALAPIDKTSLVSAVQRAAREKIPVVIFDSGIETDQFVAQVATDNYHAGEIAAERIGKILGGKGQIAMVMVQPGAASTMARENGFQKKIADAYPDIHIVAQQYGWADFAKSLTVAENMLTAHPDLDAMFASNESSTVGAAQALKGRKDSKVKLVGFDSSPTLIEDLKAGLIDSLVVQDPFKMGYDSVKSAVAALNGETVAKIQNLAPKLVDRDNLKTPEVQAQLNPDLKKYLH